MWQQKAAKVASSWNKKIHFDFVQHVSFVSYTQPTYMYKLGIPMIFGPVAGGDNIPSALLSNLDNKEKLIEITRFFSQYLALMVPSIRKTMLHSKYIFTATEATKKRIPNKYQEKTFVLPAIGLEKLPKLSAFEKKDDTIRIVMVGNLIYWKAIDIGINAFLGLVEEYPNVELHILGEGNKKEYLQRMASKYIDDKIFFDKPVSHDDIFEYYKRFDIYINTTLRDSGCMAMMEAMCVGIPCICIATGGPKILSSSIPELQISISQYDTVVNELKYKLINLIENKEYREELGLKSLNQSMNNTYHKKYLHINEFYKKMK